MTGIRDMTKNWAYYLFSHHSLGAREDDVESFEGTGGTAYSLPNRNKIDLGWLQIDPQAK